MDAKNFGKFIAEVRKEKNITQSKLAEEIGVTDKAVSRWERGVGFPDITLLESLSEALDVSIVELMKSKRIDDTDEKENVSETNMIDYMSSAVEMAKANSKQDLHATIIAVVIGMTIAVFNKTRTSSNVMGSIVLGGWIAVIPVSIYYYVKNMDDSVSRKIYAFFITVSVGGIVYLLNYMEYFSKDFMLTTLYILFCIGMYISNK